MGDAATLLELGDRYWALGLPAAARSALQRALVASGDAAPGLRLADIALAQGDAPAARRFAAEAAKRSPGAETKIVLARAHLAAGEVTAARMSLLAALDVPELSAWDRARAHLGLARAAQAQLDNAGAGANAAAAFDAAVEAATNGPLDLGVCDEIAAAVVAHDRARDASASIEGARAKLGSHALAAALLAARHAAGDSAVTEVMIDEELAAAERQQVDVSLALRLRRLERRAWRGGASVVRVPGAELAQLAAELETLAQGATGETLATGDRARLHFLRASVYEEQPDTHDRAEEAYRKGLTFQPGHTAAACRLALLVLDRGDHAGALAEIERALRIDATYGAAWRNAVRMLDAASPSLGPVVGRLLDAANPGAGSAAGDVAPRLVTATAEVARHDALAGVYAHGHRVKNLLGIIGARARSARKLVGEGEVHDRLKDLEKDVTALYEEWAEYLRSLQAPTPQIEVVSLASLLHEVVVAAQARAHQVPITLDHASLPDVRGDRTLLREALLNIVSNAAEACVAMPAGAVRVRVRALAAPGASAAPLVEIVVEDTGPGIPRAHLARLFVPGFTTKETGSGVGLAIAERVVAAHHGRITVESEEGRGTTITVTLPSDHGGLVAMPRWRSDR
jgi:signal transduction histidine kinase